MANVLVENQNLVDIADAIRSKLSTQDTFKPSEMAAAIETIEGGGITPTGTKSITANGTYDVTAFASAEVNVSTGGADLGTKTITENGTYNASSDNLDGYNSVTVNVQSASGYDANEIAERTYQGNVVADEATNIASSAFAGSDITGISAPLATRGSSSICSGCTSLTSVNLPLIVQKDDSSATSWFDGCTSLQTIILPKLTKMWNYFFRGCTALKTVVLPSLSNSRQNNFNTCSALKTVDLGTSFSSIIAEFWNASPLLDTLILRRTAGVVTLANVSAFTGAMASDGSGGTVYVPSALISSYQSASNWATLYSGGTVTFSAIEGSIYENAYADGTAIS